MTPSALQGSQFIDHSQGPLSLEITVYYSYEIHVPVRNSYSPMWIFHMPHLRWFDFSSQAPYSVSMLQAQAYLK